MITAITAYVRGRSSAGKGQWCFPKELVFNLSPKNKLVKQNRVGAGGKRQKEKVLAAQ